VPYGLARARVADALLARDENGRLCSGGSAAIQRVMIRLRNRGWIELAPPSAHGLRTIVAIRCLNGHEDNARS